MKRAFITYSHKDEPFVDKLTRDLDRSGISVSLDKRIVRAGASLLKIFEEIGNSDFLVPIFSSSSVASNWVRKEVGVALIKEIEEKEFTIIPVVAEGENRDELQKSIPKALKEALRDRLWVRFDQGPYEEKLKELVTSMSGDIDPLRIYASIEGPKGTNPFRHLRTEYFEDAKTVARSFTEPETALYERIVEVRPTLIQGGRGSGKTMLLKSLQANVSVYRSRKTSFREAGLKFYGVYCKLSRGSFSTSTGQVTKHIDEDIATRLFENELILKLTQTLISELASSAANNLLSINRPQETNVASRTWQLIKPIQLSESILVDDFTTLQDRIMTELKRINDYVSRIVLRETPTYDGSFMSQGIFESICSSVVEEISDLNGATIYFLLDEYENLEGFQKIVVNTLIKKAATSFFSMKVASKKTGFKDTRTMEGQPLEEGDDYTLRDVDYNTSEKPDRERYKQLLVRICEKTLEQEDYKITDIQQLLEINEEYDGIPRATIIGEVQKMTTEQGKRWEKLHPKEQEEYLHRLGMAALYRLLFAQRNRRKKFGGFDDFAHLSSGIIRHFLELCGMSYHFAIADGIDVKAGQTISVESQTNAAYALSSYYLIKLKSIPDEGPRIQQLAIDLGDIFRRKLIIHLSEPEAARIAIVDPQSLEYPKMKELRTILDLGQMHSAWQITRRPLGMRPKHVTDVQPVEYLLHRIYCPILGFSPRLRWRTSFEVSQLQNLVKTETRPKTKAELVRKASSMKRPRSEVRQPVLDDY